MATLNQVLETAMQLPLDQQEMLIEILQNRHVEQRREEIARDAKESLQLFREGKLNPQPVEAIIAELRQSLESDDE
jgi:phosphoenolpyruvate synthase/pyruvate phosphate dikinase